MLRGHRADHDVVALAADALQPVDAVEVDEVLGRREPQLHHRDQAVAAGERPRLVAELGEQLDRVGDVPGGDR